MDIKIDFRSRLPIYEQIVDQVTRRVMEGELKPGDQLPTVRQLATDLRVNFNTVARAYRILDETRLISTQQGRGTYIWEKPAEDVILLLRQQSLEELTRSYLAEARQIGFGIHEITEMINEITLAQDENSLKSK